MTAEHKNFLYVDFRESAIVDCRSQIEDLGSLFFEKVRCRSCGTICNRQSEASETRLRACVAATAAKLPVRFLTLVPVAQWPHPFPFRVRQGDAASPLV